MTLRSLSERATRDEFFERQPRPRRRAPAHGSSPISSTANSRLSGSSTRQSRSLSSTMFVSSTTPSSSVLLPGSMPLRRTWPTPSANSRFAGMMRYASAPIARARKSQCCVIENPCGTLSVVHSRYAEPGVSASVERMTTCPENGSSLRTDNRTPRRACRSVDLPGDERARARGSSPSASDEFGGSFRRRALRAGARARPSTSRSASSAISANGSIEKTGDPILGYRENSGVDRIGDFGWDGLNRHLGKLPACRGRRGSNPGEHE